MYIIPSFCSQDMSCIVLYTIRTQTLFSHSAMLQGYQFWCRADVDGSFYIRNIVTGNYNLYAWVPGFLGDYKLDATVTIASGKHLQLATCIHIYPLATFS